MRMRAVVSILIFLSLSCLAFKKEEKTREGDFILNDIRKSLSEQRKGNAKSGSAKDTYYSKGKEGKPVAGNEFGIFDWESSEDKAVEQTPKMKESEDYDWESSEDKAVEQTPKMKESEDYDWESSEDEAVEQTPKMKESEDYDWESSEDEAVDQTLMIKESEDYDWESSEDEAVEQTPKMKESEDYDWESSEDEAVDQTLKIKESEDYDWESSEDEAVEQTPKMKEPEDYDWESSEDEGVDQTPKMKESEDYDWESSEDGAVEQTPKMKESEGYDWESSEDEAVDQTPKMKESEDYDFHGGEDAKVLHATHMEQGITRHKNNRIVVDTLKTISKVQQAIISILTKMEEDRMHGKICNLLGLSNLLASLNIAKYSINPLMSEDYLSSWKKATSLMHSRTPKTSKQRHKKHTAASAYGDKTHDKYDQAWVNKIHTKMIRLHHELDEARAISDKRADPVFKIKGIESDVMDSNSGSDVMHHDVMNHGVVGSEVVDGDVRGGDVMYHNVRDTDAKKGVSIENDDQDDSGKDRIIIYGDAMDGIMDSEDINGDVSSSDIEYDFMDDDYDIGGDVVIGDIKDSGIIKNEFINDDDEIDNDVIDDDDDGIDSDVIDDDGEIDSDVIDESGIIKDRFLDEDDDDEINSDVIDDDDDEIDSDVVDYPKESGIIKDRFLDEDDGDEIDGDVIDDDEINSDGIDDPKESGIIKDEDNGDEIDGDVNDVDDVIASDATNNNVRDGDDRAKYTKPPSSSHCQELKEQKSTNRPVMKLLKDGSDSFYSEYLHPLADSVSEEDVETDVKHPAQGHNLGAVDTLSRVKLAGTTSMERCKKCENRGEEEVCGANGQTFETLCHAVNCAGLALSDITSGACNTKDVCAESMCEEDKVCVPKLHGLCLNTYSQDGYKRLSCHQYSCVDVRHCGKEKLSPVCGMDGKTYNSLCVLHKAKQFLAYNGTCRPGLCKDQVCGADKNTYASICHAHARRIRVDHAGKCFPTMSQYFPRSNCATIRQSGLCLKKVLCRDPVIPNDACCPICGGSMEIALDSKKLAQFTSANEDNNHLYVLEQLLRDILPLRASEKCELFGELTNSGNLSIVLEAINAGNHAICSDALQELGKPVHRVQSYPSFKSAYSIFNPVSWVHDQALGVQDTVIDSPVGIKNVIKNRIGMGLLEAEDYVEREKNGAQLFYIWLPYLILVGCTPHMIEY